MKSSIYAACAATALMFGAATAQADATTDCAAVQGKAAIKAFNGIAKEAAKACAKGEAGDALAVSQAKIAKTYGKALAGAGKGLDRSGPFCGLYAELDDVGPPSQALDQAQGMANDYCLVED